jgi:hypothetical protein
MAGTCTTAGRPRSAAALALQVLLLNSAPTRTLAHMTAVCTATHPIRPGQVTFLFASYHEAPAAGSGVAGSTHIKTPTGSVHEFPLDSFCAIPLDSNQYPVPLWSVDEDVSSYRERLLQLCVCSQVFDCGSYDSATQMCTSTAGDCPLLDPKTVHVDCYGQDYDVPTSEGAWVRALGDSEPANCAFGAVGTVDYARWTRVW